MIDLSNLADECFRVLKGYGKVLTLYDDGGTKTYDPSEARRMFSKTDGMMLTLVSAGEDSYILLSVGATTDIESITPIVDTLRLLASRANVLFNLRKYGKQLKPKDFATMKVNVTEGLETASKAKQWVETIPIIVLEEHGLTTDQLVTELTDDFHLIENGIFPGDYVGLPPGISLHDDMGIVDQVMLNKTNISDSFRFYLSHIKTLHEANQECSYPQQYVTEIANMLRNRDTPENKALMQWFMEDANSLPNKPSASAIHELLSGMLTVDSSDAEVSRAIRVVASMKHNEWGMTLSAAKDMLTNIWQEQPPILSGDVTDDFLSDIEYDPHSTPKIDRQKSDAFYSDLTETTLRTLAGIRPKKNEI